MGFRYLPLNRCFQEARSILLTAAGQFRTLRGFPFQSGGWRTQSKRTTAHLNRIIAES
jgi:hypothetical protein